MKGRDLLKKTFDELDYLYETYTNYDGVKTIKEIETFWGDNIVTPRSYMLETLASRQQFQQERSPGLAQIREIVTPLVEFCYENTKGELEMSKDKFMMMFGLNANGFYDEEYFESLFTNYNLWQIKVN